MSLARKLNIEDHQKTDREKLNARLELLKSQGVADARIAHDPKVKQMKAKIRKGRLQLERLAALKKQNAENAEATAKRRAEAKAAVPAPKKEKSVQEPKKSKKEKKQVAE
jgi:hypothetical protein